MSREYTGFARQILNIGYLSRYLSVGIVGAVFDNIVLAIGVEVFALYPLLAKALSAELSILLMFCINERWTFAGHSTGGYTQMLRRLATSHFVRFGGLAVGIIVLGVLHNKLGVWYLLANVIGIGFGFLVNYTLETLFTWKAV